MIRRLMVIGLLIGGALLLEPLRVPTAGVVAPRSLFLFGLLLLVADTFGTFFHAAGLPRIVGFLAAGIALGPSLAGFVPPSVLGDLGMIKELAVGSIGLLAGVELRIAEVRERGRVILSMLIGQLAAVLPVLVLVVVLGRAHIPFAAGLTGPSLVLIALVFGTILTVNSPMVTLAMLTETGARGPLARTVLGVVLVADVVVILLFTIFFSLAQASLGAAGASAWRVFGSLFWELGGSVVAGAVVGALIGIYLRYVKLELVLFVIVVVFATAALADALHFELLLTLLTAGFVVENVAPVRAEPLVETLHQIAWPVFVVFFALAGAELHVQEFLGVWPVVLVVALGRGFAMRIGASVGARRGGAEAAVVQWGWMGLVSQAGVALGLAAVLAQRMPGLGEEMGVVIVGVIAVNETVGAILFRRGLQRAGELADAGLHTE